MGRGDHTSPPDNARHFLRCFRRGRRPRRPADNARHPHKPCHCEERSDVAIRTPFAPHHLIMFPWGGVTTPRRPITHGTSCDVFVGGGVPDAPPISTAPPQKACHCEPARTLVWQSVFPLCRTITTRGNGFPRRFAPRNDSYTKILLPSVGRGALTPPPDNAPHSLQCFRRGRRPRRPADTRRTLVVWGKRIPTSLRSSE